MGPYQVHLAGPQRAGKTTLGKRLAQLLASKGARAVFLDVDEVRRGIFQEEDEQAVVDSPDNKRMQGHTYNALYNVIIPQLLSVGVSTIMAATHAHPQTYNRSLVVAQRFGIPLRYILLEPATTEEVARRSGADTDPHSDIRDLANERQLASYQDVLARYISVYRSGTFHEPHLWILQDTPERMAERALRYILSGE